MKKRIRRARAERLLRLLLCALLMVGMLLSSGAQGAQKNNTGTISVVLSEKDLPDSATVEFTLYKIGGAKIVNGEPVGWKMNADLANYGVIEATTSSDLGKAAQKVYDAIKGKYTGTTKKLAYTGQTNKSKKKAAKKNAASRNAGEAAFRADFTGLEDGLYLGAMTSGPTGLKVTPFIAGIPHRDPPVTGELSNNNTVTVKSEYTPPAPTDEPTTEPTEEPDEPPTEPDVTPVPTTEIVGRKVWDDNHNEAGMRPGSIEITLYADGSPVSAAPTWAKDGDEWTFTFSNLPKYGAGGSEIKYTVDEKKVDFYEEPSIDASNPEAPVITNRILPPNPSYIDIEVTKAWIGVAEGDRPDSVMISLIREQDHAVLGTKQVTADSGWKVRFEHIQADDGYGHKYTFTLDELGMDGYEKSRSHSDDYREMTLTNIKQPTPPPPPEGGDGPTPNTPPQPEDIPDRRTGTPVPNFEDKSDEELEELFDLFDYKTPLYGMFGTGDYIPVWVWVCGGCGILAIVLAIVLGRKKKRS